MWSAPTMRLRLLALALLLAPTDGLKTDFQPTVGDVIKNHANLTTFATALGSADLSSFLSAPTVRDVFGYTVLAPSDAAFAKLPAAARGMFDVASLRYEILAHHINLVTTTPNAICASAEAPLPGYQVTTMASQHLSILCYTCKGAQGGDACPTVDAKDTLGNAVFVITATPIVASNGVVVVIDGILLPAWLPPADAPIRPAPPANNEPIVFRALIKKLNVPVGCGQVDAASSVPPALYEDEGKLKRYISLTLSGFFMPRGLTLELGTCAEAGFTTLDTKPHKINTTPWTTGDLFAYYCASGDEDTNYGADTTGCGCVIGLCPEVPPPDKPICAVCNAVSNRPREITYFIRGDTPAPPPPSDIFGFVLDVLRKTPELSTLYNVVQGNATHDNTGYPYKRECPRGAQSPDCSIPSEEPDGRQTFTGTIEEKGPWTFFAPDNAAFAKAPQLTAALLAGWQGGKNELFLDNNFDTLYYHLLEGNFTAAQLPNGETNTLLGADLTTSHLGKGFTFVTGGTTNNVARIKKSIRVTNGIVHIISAVLTPPADTRRSKQQGFFTCCAAGVAGSCCDACCKGGNIQCC